MLNRNFPTAALALVLFSIAATGCQKPAPAEEETAKAHTESSSLDGAVVEAGFPQWAFPGTVLKSLPGSTAKYSDVIIFDRTRAVDWYPNGHPAMPDVVKGTLPVYACAFCHLPEGAGRSENAALAGLPAEYIMRQMGDFKSGARKTPDRKFGAGVNMELTAAQISDEDIKAAANYFSSLTYKKHLTLVESADVPSFKSNAFIYVINKNGPREPLGQRIIEGPDDFELFEMRDPNMTFTAYVPVGAVARGAALAKGEGGAGLACGTCHGPGLKGSEIAPPLAGRLPTGLFRQMYAFKTGTRNGVQAAVMKPVVESLSEQNMIDLASYLASLEP